MSDINDQLFNETIGLFQKFEEVDAIVLGGSRASGKFDSDSDYDVYVYLNNDLSMDKRKAVLSRTCKYMEINNAYFEVEDDCVLNNGINIDIIYRWLHNTVKNLEDTLEKHVAWYGYTTCICWNVFNSKVLYDPKGLYADMVKRFTMPYPEPLRKNIISRNRELLEGKIPSYINQIEAAIKRNDVLSINHRIAEFVKSYFDILFALNRAFHPGEKRMMQFGLDLCELLPVDFESDLNNLFLANGNEKTIPILRKLVLNIDALIRSTVA